MFVGVALVARDAQPRVGEGGGGGGNGIISKSQAG